MKDLLYIVSSKINLMLFYKGLAHQTILAQAQVVRFVPNFPEVMTGGQDGILLWDVR